MTINPSEGIQGVKFNDFVMKKPASSGYFKVIFKGDDGVDELNTINVKASGKEFPASSVTIDVGKINYHELEIFSYKKVYIKNISNLETFSVDYIEDEDFTISKFHKKWIYDIQNTKSSAAVGGIGAQAVPKLWRIGTPGSVEKKFAKTINVVKYKDDWDKKLFEFEAKVVPDISVAFSFNWDDSALTKTITYKIVELTKLDFF